MSLVVYLDDEPDGPMAEAGHPKQINAFPFDIDDPNGSTARAYEAGKNADAWLFDFFLVQANPAASDLDDENGLSLFQKWKAELGWRPVTALVSSDLGRALGVALGPVERHHVIAQQQGVEWIGAKNPETFRRVVELAEAAEVVATAIKPKLGDGPGLEVYPPDTLAYEVLGVPEDADWRNSALRQIDRARPPRQVSASSGPAAAQKIVAWLVGHVLPYPSFLLTEAQAAVRLGVTPASFKAIASLDPGGDDWRSALEAARYRGPLAAFLGPRWWRAAIDNFAWRLTQEEAGLKAVLERAAAPEAVEWLTQNDPVVVSGPDLVETGEIADARDCVRATDEDFPANVEPAWVTLTSAREDKELSAKVIFEDRDLLEAGE